MSMRETPHLTDEQLDDYVDGTLSETERALAESHIASCERCRRAVGDTRELIATAQQQRASVAAPSELWPLVASSTIHLAAVRRQVLRSMRGLLVTGALAIAAATAVITWQVARWTSEPRAMARSTAAPRASRIRSPGPAGHPVVPEPPIPPSPPDPSRR
jgi:anti-sigma factor RsiW